ncbi:MAG: alpha/beta hydrolase [Actinomycetota bacterium]
MRLTQVGIVTLSCLVSLAGFGGPAWAQRAKFTPPVDAEVVRGFEKPSHKYGPGHRGIDYAVPSGTPVRASANGAVKFAGSVGGQGQFITLQHAGDIETTYSYLSAIEVSEGEQVTQGQVIGRSGAGHPDGPPALHFGAKRAGEYIDPLILLGQYDDIRELLELEEAVLARAVGAQVPETPQPAGPVPVSLGDTDGPVGVLKHDAPSEIHVPGDQSSRGGSTWSDDPMGRRLRGSDAGDGPNRLEKPLIPYAPPETIYSPIHDDAAGTPRVFHQPLPIDFETDEATGLPRGRDVRPEYVEDWWGSLTEAERKRLVAEQANEIGNLVGVPVEVRDQANRLVLGKRLEELEHELGERVLDPEMSWWERNFEPFDPDPFGDKADSKPSRFFTSYFGLDGLTKEKRELRGVRRLSRELVNREAEFREAGLPDDVFLIELDTGFARGDGKAVVAFGDPYSAEYVATVVPGINNSLANAQGLIGDASSLKFAVADLPGVSAETTATVAWLGYDTPNGLIDARSKDEAEDGSRALTRFIDDLHRPVSVNMPSITAIGHSYGASVVGRAACEGLNTQNVALLGSPGAACDTAYEMGHPEPRVWAARTEDDPITMAIPLAPLGADPMGAYFGGQLIPLDAERQRGHDGYFVPRTDGFENIARIVVEQYGDID